MIEDLKNQDKQSIGHVIEIKLDKCKYTTDALVNAGAITLNSALTQGFEGTIGVAGGDTLAFTDGDPYLVVGDEVIKVVIDNQTQVTIPVGGRGSFGTIDAAHPSGSAQLIHSGEADGTCFGFPQRCSSPDSFQDGLLTTFTFATDRMPHGTIQYPGLEIKSIKHRATQIYPAEKIGTTASLSFSIGEFEDDDSYVPYPDRRTDKSTFFRKLRQRMPIMDAREVVWYSGFNVNEFDVDNFYGRKYLIKSVNRSAKKINFIAEDPLNKTNEEKSLAPIESKPRVSVEIDDLSTTINYSVDSVDESFDQVGSFYVRIDSEVFEVSVFDNSTLTIITRAFLTEKKDHKVNATIQLVLSYEKVNVVDIIEDLLTNYTNIPAVYLADYSFVKAATSDVLLTAYVTKPTEVKKLINELLVVGDLILYYDEVAGLIEIKKVGFDEFTDTILSEEQNILTQVDVDEREGEQWTRYSSAWSQNDITKTSGEENFSIILLSVDAERELPVNKGEKNQKKIFYNRWLTNDEDDILIGSSLVQRELDRSVEIPVYYSFQLDVQNVFDGEGGGFLGLGSIVNIQTPEVVDQNSDPAILKHQILRLQDMGYQKYKVLTRLFQGTEDVSNFDFVIDENKENYDLSSEFSPPNPGVYTILIESNVTIGSTSTSNFSFTTGTQAAGVSFAIINRGKSYGAGGGGGDGGNLVVTNPVLAPFELGEEGERGGGCWELTVDTVINNGAGIIYAGGGGASGASSASDIELISGDPVGIAGDGGSGGRGYIGGLGGLGGSVTGAGFNGTGQPGNNGTFGAPGEKNGVAGGDWGEQGEKHTQVNNTFPIPNANGGEPGYAIYSRANVVVTISSGSTSLNLRGLIVQEVPVTHTGLSGGASSDVTFIDGGNVYRVRGGNVDDCIATDLIYGPGVIIEQFSTGNNPRAITNSGNEIYIMRSSSSICTRYDLSGVVLGTFGATNSIGNPLDSGIAYDGSSLWAAGGGEVRRYDYDSQSNSWSYSGVTKSVLVGSGASVTGIAFDSISFWVAYSDRKMRQYSVDFDYLSFEFDLSGEIGTNPPTGIAWDPNTEKIWVTSNLGCFEYDLGTRSP